MVGKADSSVHLPRRHQSTNVHYLQYLTRLLIRNLRKAGLLWPRSNKPTASPACSATSDLAVHLLSRLTDTTLPHLLSCHPSPHSTHHRLLRPDLVYQLGRNHMQVYVHDVISRSQSIEPNLVNTA